MADYDFLQLSPPDFERLANDLLKTAFKLNLKPFAEGRDDGIDLRCFEANDVKIIVQVKHYRKTGFSKLKSNLRLSEMPKIERLAPSRYILVTSLALTPSNTSELLKILSPYCQSEQDILGADDLNALLRKFGDVERTHYKLWIGSSAVLERAIKSDLYFNKLVTEQQARLNISKYVDTGDRAKILALLAERGVCLITGDPGVGKTELAEMALLEMIEEGWEILPVSMNISEALRSVSVDPDVRQCVYYDDFLGQISYGEKLSKNEDRVLGQLIDYIVATPNRRLLLTTREYILQQAEDQHEILRRQMFDRFAYRIDSQSWSKKHKAAILANHLHASRLPVGLIHAILDQHFYREIVKHRNFNPRLIESMLTILPMRSNSPEDFQQDCLQLLNFPEELWYHSFHHQIGDPAKILLICIYLCDGSLNEKSLHRLFDTIYRSFANKLNWAIPIGAFYEALRVLEGTFVKISRNQRLQETRIDLANHSVADFLFETLRARPDWVFEYLESTTIFEPIEKIASIWVRISENTEIRMSILEACAQAVARVASVENLGIINSNHRIACAVLLHKALEKTPGNQFFEAVGKYISSIYFKIPYSVEDLLENINYMLEKDPTNSIRSVVFEGGFATQLLKCEDILGLCSAAIWIKEKGMVVDRTVANEIRHNLLPYQKGTKVVSIPSKENLNLMVKGFDAIEEVAACKIRDIMYCEYIRVLESHGPYEEAIRKDREISSLMDLAGDYENLFDGGDIDQYFQDFEDR